LSNRALLDRAEEILSRPWVDNETRLLLHAAKTVDAVIWQRVIEKLEAKE
jgi:hypothetical protein